ncbi:TPA: 30S ribosomal protein S17 [Candidatus Saccharibacteria bacterium]|nr:MAG: 30S ribosomal protein S17 [Candidatus Saccharibacteria bacterium GW2011_GWA2_46_10]OGL35535.1 MAG: 30S ribosomal protein S17 [Candidatus Saccharibacteria bacterium RIFCSPHIGHO2_12_FULL_47_17]HCM51760.1 30S ribosomal protein S17 [Candidatus Saccharibacteria bacterium]
MARLILGIVSSDKSDKTIVVTLSRRKTHPIYKKQYGVSRKIMAHDEKNEAKVGDKVMIRESRPLSARKRFVLDKIVEKAHRGFEEADATADVPEEQKTEDSRQKTDEKAEDQKAVGTKKSTQKVIDEKPQPNKVSKTEVKVQTKKENK